MILLLAIACTAVADPEPVTTTVTLQATVVRVSPPDHGWLLVGDDTYQCALDWTEGTPDPHTCEAP